MSTTTLEAPRTTVRRTSRRAEPEPIPMTRVVGVELRKMFDTRAGAWMLASIGILALVATGAVIVFAPESEQTYASFASAIGFPMAVVLPMIAILSVTSEWSQRTALATFTLVPSRGRVIAAKAAGALLIGVVSMVLAGLIGAVGNVVGTAISGVETTWDVSLAEFGMIVIANVLGMAVGFMLGVLLRSSAVAIVAYFVFSLLFPTLSSALAASQDWWRDNAVWFDFNYATSALFEGVPSGEQWAQIGTSSLIWLVLPLAVGLRMVFRSEVK
jgi:ABC-type transport system involved in multi-copper enzyme maturation permease subunit